MIFKLFYIFIFILSSCQTIPLFAALPIDNTPPWDASGRYGLEMVNDCNTTKHSIGISGCAFKISELGGNLITNQMWSGSIGFTSYYCNNFTAPVLSSEVNTFQIRDMYNSQIRKSCSFSVVQKVRDGKFISDNTITGRFFIKILPEYGYGKLKFSIKDEVFDGVGWYQRKALTSDAIIKVYPKSNSGIFTITCGNDEPLPTGTPGTEPTPMATPTGPRVIKRINYNESPFEVTLNSNEICDYEMVAVNAEPTGDGSDVESATYIHHVIAKYTRDLSAPAVQLKKGKIKFTFNDADISGKKPVVYSVQVDSLKKWKINSAEIADTKDTYIVKALTPSLRFFYGEYNKANKKWLIK